jgi:hypothetical protein
MITYSGLIFMMFIYMPLIVAAWYGPGDQNRQVFFDEVFDPPALVEASGKPSPLLAFDRIIAQTRQVWGDAPIAALDVRHPGDANARIVVRGRCVRSTYLCSTASAARCWPSNPRCDRVARLSAT